MVESIYGRSRIGQLTAATTTEVDSGTTLCWVNGELISYRDATLTGAGAYNLQYLRRGRLRSSEITHPVGAPFVRLDDALWKYSYTVDQIGKTVWVKFRSFNVFGRALQDLADVTAYSITLNPARVVPTAAQGLQLDGAFEAPYFAASWAAGNNAADRIIRIRNASNNALLREVVTTSTTFTYQRADALVDGALVGGYRVEVIERNSAGNAAVTAVVVVNTAPPAVSGVAATVTGTTANVNCATSSAPDAAGYVYVYSTVAGFDPTISGTVGYQGALPAGEITDLVAGNTYYLCAAAYDTWSSTRSQLNFSPAITFTT